jgi:hypothetical protein
LRAGGIRRAGDGLQVLVRGWGLGQAEHPEFALSGAAVTAGMATDAAAYDTEKAIAFDGCFRWLNP